MSLRYFPLLMTLVAGLAQAQQAVEIRAGTLVPEQLLDGANLHLAVGVRVAVHDSLWAQVEAGVDRTAITALTTEVHSPSGAVTIRADHSMWTVPMLVGAAWQAGRVGVTLLGGVAYGHATLTSDVVDGARLQDDTEEVLEPMVRARIDMAWPLPLGELVAGAGWQHVFAGERSTGDVYASGLILEVGWRADF
jgi:hypothetical protein